MSWSLDIRPITQAIGTGPRRLMFPNERTAIHSGKLGDIIYALPTCRALGINHLILNCGQPTHRLDQGLEYNQAHKLVSLLLQQNYLKKVSLVESPIAFEAHPHLPTGIEFLLDRFRSISPSQVICESPDLPHIQRYSPAHGPVHLGQLCASAQGIRVDLEKAWLSAPAAKRTSESVVVSLTPRWRSFSNWYWKNLLVEMPKVVVVGRPHELRRLDLGDIEWVESKQHLDLASLIAGSSLFLGSISFPYAIAEGLKVPRLVELCYRRLDAFPLGHGGNVLPFNVLKARKLVAKLLDLPKESDYCRWTRRVWRRPAFLARATAEAMRNAGQASWPALRG